METNNLKIGILGMGEIGSSISEFYDHPISIQDIDDRKFESGEQFDVLHVCIPFSEQFVEIVRKEIKEHAEGALVFIHSTVPVGTTRKLHYKFAVHAPVRGVHPNLVQGIKTFPMFVGADFSGSGLKAMDHLEAMGIDGIVVHKSTSSELLKLLDTTYYGVCIAFHAYAAKLCKEHNINFEVAMKLANETYNEGYTKLGKRNVVRPVLYAPEDDKIGGHCVVPNAEILQEQFGEDPILQAILRHK